MPVASTASSVALPRARVFCRHCGDPCGDESARAELGAFCCAGCASVFALLAEYRLTGFYTCAPKPGVSQRPAAGRGADRFAAFDDAGVAGRFVDPRGDASSVRFHVPAIHCASCVWLLEQLWRFDPGIVRSEVDLLRRTVRIDFRQDRTTLRRVAERLASLGYEPVIDAEHPRPAVPAARRDLYLKIGVAGFAFGNVMLFSIPRYVNGAPLGPTFDRLFGWLNLAFALPVLFYSASDYFRSAWLALCSRAITLDVPVALGLLILFARSTFDIATNRGAGFLDSFSGLVFFLLLGRLFQQKTFDALAFDRRARSFLPLSVLVDHDGTAVVTPIDRVKAGDTMIVRPQEVVPADSVLADDRGRLDYAFLTGEEAPVEVTRGDSVRAGGRVLDHAVRVIAARPASESRLLELWSAPAFGPEKARGLTDLSGRFGAWFTAGALGLALAGAIAWWPDAGRAADVATAVLIIACPCALTLAAPVTFGTAMALLGERGCYVKHPAVVFDLARVQTVVLDKTGTLTTSTRSGPVDRGSLDDRAWEAVRRLSAESVHPISRVIAGDHTAAAPMTAEATCADVHEYAGQGIQGVIDGKPVWLGSPAFIQAESGTGLVDDGRTWAMVGEGPPTPLGVTTTERPGMAETIRDLRTRYETWVLSGDRPALADGWRRLFGDRVRFGQSPGDKLEFVSDLRSAGRYVLMVGDGLNDAGALAAADVGIAVSDDTACLVPACDVVLAGARVPALPAILRFARRARGVLTACLTAAAVYNVLGLSFALSGRLTPLVTAILMPASSLSIIGLSAGLTRWVAKGALTS